MTRKVLGFLHKLEWSSPYTNPPDGKERVLVEVFIPAELEGCRVCPREIEEEWTRLRTACGNPAGSGYCHSVTAITPMIKKLPVEVLARIRKKRLRRRIEAKYPLFADEMYEGEVQRNSEYYEGKTAPDIEELRTAAENEHLAVLVHFGVGG